MRAHTLIVEGENQEIKTFDFSSPCREDVVEGAIFLSKEGVAYDAAGTSLPFSFLSMPQQHLEAELKTTVSQIFDTRADTTIQCDKHVYVPGVVPGYWNFYHLLIDCVPRVLFSLHNVCPTARILVTQFQAARLQRAHRDLLMQIGSIFGFADRLEIVDGDLLHLAKAIVPKERVRFIGSAIQMFSDMAARLPLPDRRRRIYISRKLATARRVINEECLVPVLQEFGFEQLCLEQMPFTEQIQAFRAAEVILAPHGAGLANIVFSPPGTTLIEFLQESGSYKLPIFSELAALSGVKHVALRSKPEANSQHAGQVGNMDMSVDREGLRSALKVLVS